MVDAGRRASIASYGDSYCARGERKTALRLACEAASRALHAVGLKPSDIDGVLTGRPPASDQAPQWNNRFAAAMKIVPRHSTEITAHAAGINSTLRHASMAIETGAVRFVLCMAADAAAGLTDVRSGVAQLDADPEFEFPYGVAIPSIYALIAARLLHEGRLSDHMLDAISVECQRWAVHHPFAARARLGDLTVEQVAASPMVSSPLRRLHCAPLAPPGTAGAFIVCSGADAAALTQKPLRIVGCGERSTHDYLTDRMSLRRSPIDLGELPNLTSTGCADAAAQAFKSAGLSIRDMDIVQTASNFSHVILMALVELGMTNWAELPEFIASGALAPGGTLPTNTNGGWLGFGQAGVSCVMDSIIELIRQLRGEPLGLQVGSPAVGLVHSLGGMSACHAVSILVRER